MENRIGFGPRLGAYVIDIIFVWILASLFSAMVPSLLADAAQKQVDATVSSNPMVASVYTGEMLKMLISVIRVALFVNLARLIYFSTEIFLGASVGKLLLGLKIVSVDGTDASTGVLFGRYLLKHIGKVCTVMSLICLPALFNASGSLFGFVIFVGCFFAAGDRHQTIHDMLCRTIVVKKGVVIQG